MSHCWLISSGRLVIYNQSEDGRGKRNGNSGGNGNNKPFPGLSGIGTIERLLERGGSRQMRPNRRKFHLRATPTSSDTCALA